jgi:hypothetical protein
MKTYLNLTNGRRRVFLLLAFFCLFFQTFAQKSAKVMSTNSCPTCPATPIRISLPLDRSVFQQVGNSATFLLAGQIIANVSTTQIKYQIEKLDKMGNYVSMQRNFTDIPYSNTGLFNTSITLTTGWYRITVQHTQSS